MIARPPEKLAPRGPVDAELFRRVAGGDLSALGTLFDRHHTAVRAFLARAAMPSDVDDLVQETFLTASRSAAHYDGRDEARPFLIGVAAQLARRKRRGFARLRAALSRFTESDTPPPPSAEDLSIRACELNEVRAAVERLSPDRRLALVLVEWEGQSGEEAAATLGVPVGTLYRRLHEARAEIHKTLTRWRGGKS